MTGRLGGLIAIVVLGGFTPAASAGYVAISSRSTLAGSDTLDWGNAGANLTNPANPFTITSNKGVTATVSKPGTARFERRDQGNGWSGNFTNGDHVIWTMGNFGPITIDFGVALSAAGAQFMTDSLGTFTAQIEALNAQGTVVFSSTFQGTANGFGDNSAVFAGIATTGGSTFTRLRYTGLSGVTNPNSFALNQLDFSLAPPPRLTLRSSPTPVPAPPGLTLMLTAAGCYGLIRLLKKRTVDSR